MNIDAPGHQCIRPDVKQYIDLLNIDSKKTLKTAVSRIYNNYMSNIDSKKTKRGHNPEIIRPMDIAGNTDKSISHSFPDKEFCGQMRPKGASPSHIYLRSPHITDANEHRLTSRTMIL